MLINYLKSLVKFIFYPKEMILISCKDFYYLINKKKIKIQPIFISSIPKSGSTFLENSLVNNDFYNARILIGDKKKIREHLLPPETFSYFLFRQNSIYKTHIDPVNQNIEILKKNNFKKILLNYRHPCDTFVSLYYYEKKTPSWKSRDLFYSKSLINNFTFNTFFECNIDKFLKYYFWWIDNWKKKLNENNIDYIEIRYEDLLQCKATCLDRISNFYDLSLEIFKDKKFQTLNLKKSKIPGFKNTFRKGTINNYVSEMSKYQKKYIFDKYKKEFISIDYHCEL